MNTNPLDASIIIPAYNESAGIAGCIESLLAQQTKAEFEIIVVDDGSTDDTTEIVLRYPQVRLLRQANRGAASARNLGAKSARGKALLFIDADCAATAGWVSALQDAIEGGADGAKGVFLTRQPEIVARFTQIEYEDRYDRMRPREQIDFVDTGSAAYLRSVFMEAGGFDDGLIEDEDQELSYRLAGQHRRLVFVPQASVYHQHPANLSLYMRRKFDIGRWKILVHLRHPGRAVSDSHTPPSLKVQLVLFYALALCTGAGLFKRAAWKLCPGLLAAFMASSAPFIYKALYKDPRVALVSPLMLAARAASLGSGVAYGAVMLVPARLRHSRASRPPLEQTRL